MYFIELILTKKCNQDCYYCNIFEPESEVEIDIDFLKYVLGCLPDNTAVEITGGEIGLISNIEKAIVTIFDNKNIKKGIILSNGLLRCKTDAWKLAEYWEHLIFDIDDLHIKKFYDLDLEEDHKYIIVTTEKTTKSVLKNWNHFEEIGLFRPNFFYKLMNGKTHTIQNYSEELIELYGRLNDKYCLDMLLHFRTKGVFLRDEKNLCSLDTPNPFIDFESKQVGHCAIFCQTCQKKEFSELNVKKLVERELFDKLDCCASCYAFDYGKSENTNRSYSR